MQENNQTISDYCRRTGALAVSLGLNLSDIPGKIGISKATLYAYRSGKCPISDKAWLKLEAAEDAAGIGKEKGFKEPRGSLKKGSFAESSANPNESEKGAENFSAVLREEPPPYRITPNAELLLARIALALEEIARKLPGTAPND